MSRAFVKESDGEDAIADRPPRPRGEQPCYITQTGLARLRAEYEQLERDTRQETTGLGADPAVRSKRLRMRELEALFVDAIPIDVGAQRSDDVRFGATVLLGDEAGGEHRFQIVGEDESSPAEGRISWLSPLGRALIGARVGDVVSWARPAGPLELEVLGFSFT